MLSEFLLAALVLTIGLLVTIDMSRAKSEDLHEHADGSLHDGWRSAQYGRSATAGAHRGDRGEAVPQEPAAARTAVAVDDSSPARRPEGTRPSAADHQGPHPHPATHKRSRTLRNWPVRSRLWLLVIISAAAAAVTVFCVARISAALRSSSGSLPDSSTLSAIMAGVVMIIVLPLAVWAAIITVRSVLQPLHRLRDSALAATQTRTPNGVRRVGEGDGNAVSSELELIDADSPDEIGEVARAIDQMRRETARLAASETALRGGRDATFANLSHRSHALVERQIHLIGNLRQGEQDAGRMAALFKLDYIATRMYRNSENLLILAGHEPSSHWNQPVTLVNVVRAAVSEIEEYERVVLNAHPDIAIRGGAVNDVVHLLAELAENATSFSAADTPVEVSGQLLASGGVLVDITDRGIGMGVKELAYANWQLENPSATDVSASKWMGLFVVAKLAARHGLRVRLQAAEFGGLTALVWLPDEVITQPGAAAYPGFSGFGNTKSRPIDPGFAISEQRAASRPQPTPQAGPSAAVMPSGASLSPAMGRHASTAGPGDGIVVSPTEGLEEKRRSPIFDAVEFGQFRADRVVPDSFGPAATTGSQWSSADEGRRTVESTDRPFSDGPAPARLPSRPPNPSLVPGGIPRAQPAPVIRSADAARDRLAGLQRGLSDGRAAAGETARRAAAGETANPGGEKEA